MLDPRTKLAVHIAASAIVYQFGGTLGAALRAVNPDRLGPAWFEAADFVISVINRPDVGLSPKSPENIH